MKPKQVLLSRREGANGPFYGWLFSLEWKLLPINNNKHFGIAEEQVNLGSSIRAQKKNYIPMEIADESPLKLKSLG